MKAEELGVIYDETDRELVEAHSWWLNTQGYACTKIKKNGKKTTLTMHRMLVGEIPSGLVVDHINRNPRDNRRSNLRICTVSVNAMNSNKRRGASSAHKGVSRNGEKWQVVVRVGGKLKWVGKYDTEAEAAAVAAPYFDTPAHNPLGNAANGDRARKCQWKTSGPRPGNHPNCAGASPSKTSTAPNP